MHLYGISFYASEHFWICCYTFVAQVMHKCITYVFFMVQRAAGDEDDEALTLTKTLVEENSDLSTVWNYRREILGSRLSSV